MTISNSKLPDLDWSQVKETVKLLSVSVTQVETGMKDGDKSVTTLTESFTSLVDHMNSINGIVNSLEANDQNQKVLDHCSQMSEKIQTSIVAFQFYDRLQQSLSHVASSLKGLSDLVSTPERLYNPMEWQNFQHEIRERYTMESEKVMFDAILQGKSVGEAVELAKNADQQNEDNIELF